MRVGAPTATPTTTLCPPARLQQEEPHRAALVLILGFMGVERLEESRPFRRRRNRVRIDCDFPRLLDR